MSDTQDGGSGTEGQDEYMGASLYFLPPVLSTDPEILFLCFLWYYIIVGHCRPRIIIVSYYRGAQGVILGTSIHRATFLPFVAHTGDLCPRFFSCTCAPARV
jgi:hypothetical protein